MPVKGPEPAIAGESLKNFALSPAIADSGVCFVIDPGARAPGFMLTPAPQAKQKINQYRLCKAS